MRMGRERLLEPHDRLAPQAGGRTTSPLTLDACAANTDGALISPDPQPLAGHDLRHQDGWTESAGRRHQTISISSTSRTTGENHITAVIRPAAGIRQSPASR